MSAMVSDDVSEDSLDPAEEKGARNQNEERGEGRDGDSQAGGPAAPEERPAEAFDDPHERIETVERPPGPAHETGGVGDGRREEPELDQERNRMLDVAVLHIQSREPEPEPQSGDEGEEDERWQPKQGNSKLHESVPPDHTQQHEEG